MKSFVLTGLAMAFALVAQVQAEEQVPPPPAGPYQSFALMPATPETGPQSVHFPPMNYNPESLAAPDMPEPPAWVQNRPEPPARPEWAGDRPEPIEMGQPPEMPEPPAWVQNRPEPPAMPEPAEMGRPPEMPEPPAWVQNRPEPPAMPEWAQSYPCPGYEAGTAKQPCRRFPPEWRSQHQRMPEPPAWVQERQRWQDMRGQEFPPPPRRFQRPPAWGQPYPEERGFPPAGYEQQLTPPAPPARFPSEPYRGPYAPYYPR